MGLLDKATKLATTAKGQYDELRAARDEAAVKPVAVSPLGDHERGVLERALRHGAPDPAALFSRAEASHVLGVELGEGSLTYDDSQVGLEYAAAGRRNERWSVAVGAWYGDEDGFFPAEQFQFVAEHVEGEPVGGLGEAAVWERHAPVRAGRAAAVPGRGADPGRRQPPPRGRGRRPPRPRPHRVVTSRRGHRGRNTAPAGTAAGAVRRARSPMPS